MNTKLSICGPITKGQATQTSDRLSRFYSEQAKTSSSCSRTPSWRKPDPSQWWYGPSQEKGH
jgi:hypothetical protein